MTGTQEINAARKLILIFFVLFICLFSPVPARANTALQAMDFNLPENTISRPVAAAQAADGKTYICDAAKRYVAVFDADNTPLFTFSQNLTLPRDIALSDGKVFVLDEAAHCVMVYDDDGNYTDTLGEQGLSAGQFYQPAAITIDGETLYVADTGNDRIQLFSTKTLDLLAIFAIEENGTDLSAPSALTVSGDTLYVVEAGGAEVNTYDKTNGAPKDLSLTRSSERSVDIAALGGTIAVSSPAGKCIDYYSSDMTFQKSLSVEKRVYQLSAAPLGCLLACGSAPRTGDGLLYRIAPDDTITTIPGSGIGFNRPSALAADDAGNCYVADTGNHRVLVFDGGLQMTGSILGVPQPIDLQCMGENLYVLESYAPALFVYDALGALAQTVPLDFTTNPKAFALTGPTSALVCGSSDLYLVDFSGPDPVFQTLNRELIDTPQDVTVFGDYIYLLNNRAGDILYMPQSGKTAYSVPLSALGAAPADAASLAVTDDGILYIADTAGNKIYSYTLSFAPDQKIATEDFGFSGPASLFADGETLVACFSESGQFAKLTHPVASGDYYITLDEEKIEAFDKSVTVYSEKRGADTEYVDIDCVASSGFDVQGDIGRYLLFYGLNTFEVIVSDGASKTAYTLYITRSFPDWFTLDNLDGYYAYTKTKAGEAKGEDIDPQKDASENTILLDIGRLNMDGLTITSFSKNAVATVEGSKVRIVLSGGDADDPPVIQLAADDGLVTLSAAALSQMMAQKRNQYLLYAVFAGVAVLLLVYFFLEYLKKHPGKRNYKRIKK